MLEQKLLALIIEICAPLKLALKLLKRLWPLIPDGIVAVAESGIKEVADVRELCDAGFQSVLVGELLVMASESAVTVGVPHTVDMIELKNLAIKLLITQ